VGRKHAKGFLQKAFQVVLNVQLFKKAQIFFSDKEYTWKKFFPLRNSLLQ